MPPGCSPSELDVPSTLRPSSSTPRVGTGCQQHHTSSTARNATVSLVTDRYRPARQSARYRSEWFDALSGSTAQYRTVRGFSPSPRAVPLPRQLAMWACTGTGLYSRLIAASGTARHRTAGHSPHPSWWYCAPARYRENWRWASGRLYGTVHCGHLCLRNVWVPLPATRHWSVLHTTSRTRAYNPLRYRSANGDCGRPTDFTAQPILTAAASCKLDTATTGRYDTIQPQCIRFNVL
jgi:hypothetical protein